MTSQSAAASGAAWGAHAVPLEADWDPRRLSPQQAAASRHPRLVGAVKSFELGHSGQVIPLVGRWGGRWEDHSGVPLVGVARGAKSVVTMAVKLVMRLGVFWRVACGSELSSRLLKVKNPAAPGAPSRSAPRSASSSPTLEAAESGTPRRRGRGGRGQTPGGVACRRPRAQAPPRAPVAASKAA